MAELFRNGYIHLCEAIERGNKAMIEALILQNVDLNIPCKVENTPLHRAILKFDDLDIIKILLDKGADIHAKDYHYHTPLLVAIWKNKTKIASFLIEKGALKGDDIHSLLHKAIYHNNETIVKMIIDHGMKHNPSINLFTSLRHAIWKRNPMIIEAILPYCSFSKPSDLYIPKDLMRQSDPQSTECTKLLLEWNFTINPDDHPQKFVCAAVESGHLPTVMQLLELGIDVNMVEPNSGVNPLTLACYHEYHKIAEKLLQHDADVNIKITSKLLINELRSFEGSDTWEHSGSLIDKKNDLSNITSLHIAVCNADFRMMKLLLKYGGKTIDDEILFEVTCMAVLLNNEKIVPILLDHGVIVNDIDDFQGETILYQCLDTSFVEADSRYDLVTLLLKRGADVHLRDPDNYLMFEAVAKGHRKIAQLFLDHDADIQYVGSEGDTLLHAAIQRKFDPEFIKTLLKLGAPVNKANRNKQTPLIVACNIESDNQLNTIRELLHYNASVHSIDMFSMSPLHHACNGQNAILVKILLNRGANPNVTNRPGRTPLHLVCQYDGNETTQIIQFLLDHGANTEAIDAEGWTPLFEACAANNHRTIKCLLDNYANVNHINEMKLTPLLFALQGPCYNSDTIKLLLEYKPKVYCTDMDGNSVIHLVAEKDDVELMESFIHTKANLSSVNKNGDSPLHIAAQMIYTKMTVCLLKHGADINILNNNNRTPIEEAIVEMVAMDPSGSVPLCSKYIMINLVRQVVKLKVAGLQVNNNNLNIVYNSNYGIINDRNYSDRKDMLRDIQQYEAECKQEIEEMKTESVGIDGLTFHDLLTKHARLLTKFVKNKIIKQTLELKVYDEKFPMYINIIRSRYRDIKIRRKQYKLINRVRENFRTIINQPLPDECIDKILSYLNIEELKTLVKP